jgi:hypothetical protein
MHYGKYAFSKYQVILPSFGNETYSIIPYVRKYSKIIARNIDFLAGSAG